MDIVGSKTKSVLIIPSHHPGWHAMETSLAQFPGIDSIHVVRNRRAALGVVSLSPVSVIFADNSIDGQSSYPLLALLSRLTSATVVVITASSSGSDPRDTLGLERSSFLLWRDLDTPTFHCYLAVLLDQKTTMWSSSSVHPFVDMRPSKPVGTGMLESITAREQDVLQMLADGTTHSAIAHHLDVHVRSVERILDSLKLKLDASTSARLLVQAAKLGIVE